MIYSISDLHLDYTGDKSMELFGFHWEDYEERIFQNWKEKIKEEDLVLLPGDTSWAMSEKEAYRDLKRIDNLPGKKILLKGNHDYWWKSLTKLNCLSLNTISFLQNNSFNYKDYKICGTRGWNDPSFSNFTEQDHKIFKRELLRLELSLNFEKNNSKIICMLHYPPFNQKKEPNLFTDIMEKYKVDVCIYGHLHSEGLHNVQEGKYNGIEYYCTSSDYLEFKPKLIRE